MSINVSTASIIASSEQSNNSSTKVHPPSNDDQTDRRSFKKTLDNLSRRLQRLESLDFTDAETKLTTLLTAINTIDSKLRSIQEKTQIWELLLHQVDAMADLVSTVDRKVDALRHNEDHFHRIDDKLTNLEYLVRGRVTDEDEEQANGRQPLVEEADSGAKNTGQKVRGVKRAVESRGRSTLGSARDWRSYNRSKSLPSAGSSSNSEAVEIGKVKLDPLRLESRDSSAIEVRFEYLVLLFFV